MKQVQHIKEMGGALSADKEVVYIAGQVTGLPRPEVVEKFNTTQKRLWDAGYFVINPIQIIHPDTPHREAMRICISVLPHADYIYLLPDWTQSKGAKMEKQIADILQIPVFKAKHQLGRRNIIEFNTHAELTIRSAVNAVEAMEADERLTNIVIALNAAREDLANYIDEKEGIY